MPVCFCEKPHNLQSTRLGELMRGFWEDEALLVFFYTECVVIQLRVHMVSRICCDRTQWSHVACVHEFRIACVMPFGAWHDCTVDHAAGFAPNLCKVLQAKS